MTSKERIYNILHRKPVDRIGVFEHFWGDTHKKWTTEGHINENESFENHFGFDIQMCGWINSTAKLDFEPVVLDETDDTVLMRDGNGAVLRRHKHHDTTPEHVDFLVKDRAGWEEHIKPYLTPDICRVNAEAYRIAKKEAAEKERFFFFPTVNVFECMHPVCGHQFMLEGMLMDPDWVKEMVDTYASLITDLLEQLFAQEGWPDGVFFYEDMGFKERPFVSLDMYREIIQPGHLKTIGMIKSRKVPVVMHSCGYVAPLVPGMLESGIDCLQVIEVKAGMDLLQLYKDYGDQLSFMGGMDVRTLYSNNKTTIEQELLSKIPVVKGKYGYILHSDHSIPDQVDYESYRFFVERGLELGQY